MKNVLFCLFILIPQLIWAKLKLFIPKGPPAIPAIHTAEQMESIHVVFYQDVQTEVRPKLIQNTSGMYVLPVNLAAKLYQAGIQIKMMGVLSTGMLYIVSHNKQITSLNSLNGQSITIPAPGSSPDVIARTVLQANDIKVRIKTSSTTEAVRALIQDKISTAVLPEPFASLLLSKSTNNRRVVSFNEEWKLLYPKTQGIPQVGLFVLNGKTEIDPSLIKQFTINYSKSVNWVNSHAKDAGKFGASKLKLPIKAKVMEQAIPHMNLVWIPALTAKPDVETYLTILQGNNSEITLPQADFYTH